nr:leucine-rich repeat-containing protein 31 isoform X1 [Paramormyrops kingsleyae]
MMERLDSQKTPKRSPLDLIMNQIRRKKSFSERLQKPSVSRFFRPFESEDRKESGVSEEGEDKEDVSPGTGESEPLETEPGSVVGWGRVRQFVQRLGRQPDSQSLSLSHCDLTATDVVELATLLPFLSGLDEMDLSWNDLIGGSLKALTFHLQHVCRLRALRLSGCRLSTQDLAALGETLEELPLLEVLDLSWNAGLGGHLQFLAAQLRSGCRLKELHLVDCGLTAADVGAMGAVLSRLLSLELLDLSTNQLLGGALGNLVPQLRDTPGLRVLRLRGCGLELQGLEMLGGVLEFLPTLQELDLSCNRGVSGGLALLGAQLGGLAQLRCLDVHECCLTEDDVQALVQALPSLCDITMLDLSSNKKLGGVSHQLFAGIPLGNVKRLNLSSCCLTEEAYLALGTLSTTHHGNALAPPAGGPEPVMEQVRGGEAELAAGGPARRRRPAGDEVKQLRPDGGGRAATGICGKAPGPESPEAAGPVLQWRCGRGRMAASLPVAGEPGGANRAGRQPAALGCRPRLRLAVCPAECHATSSRSAGGGLAPLEPHPPRQEHDGHFLQECQNEHLL